MKREIAVAICVVGIGATFSAAYFWRQAVAPAVSSAQPDATQDNRIAPTPKGPHEHRDKAASVTRSINLSAQPSKPTAETTPATKSAASSRETASGNSGDHTTRPDGQPTKSTAELFEKFLADDPTQVFQSGFSVYHAAAMSEPADPQWSPVVNQQLHDYLAAQLGASFEDPVVDCRTDLCEVRIAGNVGADQLFVQQVLGQLSQQPWWSSYELDQHTMAMTMKQNRPLLVLFISRQ